MVGDRYFYSVFDECSLYFRTFFVQIICWKFLELGTFTTFSIIKLNMNIFGTFGLFSIFHFWANHHYGENQVYNFFVHQK